MLIPEIPEGIITPREQIRLKIEAKKRAEELNNTFKPQLAASTPTYAESSTMRSGDAFENLYQKGLKALVNRNEAGKGAVNPECTFHPKTVATPPRGAMSRIAVGPFERLTSPAHAVKLEESKAQVVAALDKEITGKPKISPYAQQKARSTNEPVLSRLYKDAEDLRIKRELLIEEYELREEQKLTFSPELVASTKSHAARISAGSELEAEGQKEDVAERMARYATQYAERRALLEEEHFYKEASKNTFRPLIKVPLDIATSNENVFTRLHQPHRAPKVQAPPKRPSFCPKTNVKHGKNGTTWIDAGRASRVQSKNEDVHARLYNESSSKRARQLQRAERDLLDLQEALTFTPTINPPPSGSVIHSEPIFDRLSNGHTKAAKAASYSFQKEKEDKLDCSFSPKINPVSKSFNQQIRYSQPIYERLSADSRREKEAIREQLKRAEEAKVMRARPQVNAKSISIVKKMEIIKTEGVTPPPANRRRNDSNLSPASPKASSSPSQAEPGSTPKTAASGPDQASTPLVEDGSVAIPTEEDIALLIERFEQLEKEEQKHVHA
jgi:hypothetical protein